MKKKLVKEDMVAGPYNPTHELTFKDDILDELSKLFNQRKINNAIYTTAIQVTLNAWGNLAKLYRGKKNGLAIAVKRVIDMSR